MNAAQTPERYVALLRGINVGVKKAKTRIAMEDLRAIAESLGWGDVATYLNSGNVVFTPPKGASERTLAEALRAAIEKHSGFGPPALVRPLADFATIAQGCRQAFPNIDDKKAQIAFLSVAPQRDPDLLLADVAEEHQTLDRAIALHYINGVGTSKLDTVRLEKLLGVIVTVRGIRTVEALANRFN